ncbi:unnamed protein product [Auanema sp. JU1783]|nr:unnamed protein product [Auanema sp. JU1783]
MISNMSSVAATNGQSEAPQIKKKVHIVTNSPDADNSMQRALGGATPNGEFPSTAELMHKCLSVNPFEAKFAEANRRISAGVLEANGLAPPSISLASTHNSGLSLLKIPSSLSESPGIFSNINILRTEVDNANENLTTADISKLLQTMKDPMNSADITQAPRTAEVLNTVLDMHSDRLHTINYLNNPDFASIFSSLAPTGSAPNSAGVLGVTTSSSPSSIPTTSGGLLAPPSVVGTSPSHSPQQAHAQQPSSRDTDKRSPAGSDISLSNSQPNLLAALHQPDPLFDPRDVKPVITQKIFSDDSTHCSSNIPSVAIPGSTSLMSLDDQSRDSSPPTGGHTPTGVGRGRGRGRAALNAELPQDDRRMTILERNKAAAVRYRKRKKEEHDDMITRVHNLEQEKAQLTTRNQVLCRELEHLKAIIRERESRCVCLKGVNLMNVNHRADSPIDVTISYFR